MINVIVMILDILLLGVFVMDYLKTEEYLEELERMKHDIWKMNYEVSEMGDRMSRYEHG